MFYLNFPHLSSLCGEHQHNETGASANDCGQNRFTQRDHLGIVQRSDDALQRAEHGAEAKHQEHLNFGNFHCFIFLTMKKRMAQNGGNGNCVIASVNTTNARPVPSAAWKQTNLI